MERGLLWLPLLVTFIWLAWSGWNEYQKLEAYKVWAEDFDNAKFDIFAVLGKKERQVTWGKPTRKGMIDLQSFSLDSVEDINLLIDNQPYDKALLDSMAPEELPQKGKTALEFSLIDRQPIQVPFTDVTLAAKWRQYLAEARSSCT
ncbi:MAG: hypothetical protein AAF298_04280 [Cyanobacteria bacterium P01_A01_bin.40]